MKAAPSPVTLKIPDTPISELSIAALVDELGPLQEKIRQNEARMAPSQKRADDLLEELRKRVTGPDAINLDGKIYFATMGQKNFETKIDVTKAFKKLPRAVFLSIAKLGVEGLKAVCPDWEAMVTKARTGSRTVVTHRHPDPEPAA